MSCLSRSDRSFGPRIDSRCRSFDFTLQFEDIFFACLPAGLFLILSPSLIVPLLRKPILLSDRSKVLASKLIVLTILLAVQLVFLILRSVNLAFKTNASVAADTLSLVATGTAIVLSFLSHQRSARPSTFLSLYLSVSVILGVARTRTVWLLESHNPVPVVMTIAFALSVLVLFAESIETKPNFVTDEKLAEETRAPERSSGLWARTCFTWLAATFRRGYSKVISVDDLPALDSKLESGKLHEKLITTWDKYNRRDRHSLLRACFRSFFFSAVSPVIPRLCLTAFTFSQPFLINTTVTFVDLTNPDSSYGKGLIGAWALVYLGIAASHSIYQYQNFRFTTRLRGSLISLVYQYTIQIREVERGNITGVALMGTDVERIVRGMQLFHEVWASLLDVAIASWLLGEQLFLACLAPILLVVVFIGITSRVSLSTKTAQLRWIEKIQERLRVTTTLLGEMKAVKMLGLTQVMASIVQRFRMDEINTSKRFRKLLVLTLLLSLTPINLAPVVTFSIYAIIAVFWKNETLLTAQAFTSVALISLLTTPVVVFIQALPMVVQCIASFDRIQEYCNYNASVPINGDHPRTAEAKIESEVNLKSLTKITELLVEKEVISFEDESFGWDKNGVVVLKNLTVKIRGCSVTAIVGPVGSGKSSFLNAILGEMIPISTTHTKAPEGKLEAQAVAYCSQQAWLENRTICQNIIGVSDYDRTWYDTVKWACNLDADIEQLQNGDHTRVGSKGLNLSGGQKQRIALARAIYSRRTIAILDDVFSGMDANTANLVSSRLLGEQGLFRKNQMTVVIATHSHKTISLADMIIALEDGKIVETGSPTALHQSKGYIGKLQLELPSLDNAGELVPDDRDPELSRDTSSKNEFVDTAEETTNLLTDARRKNGDVSVYKYYLDNAGYIAVGLYTLALVTWIFCTEFSTIWIKWWAEANTEHPNQKVGMYVGIYAIFGLLATFAASMTAWFAFINIISNTAANLHSVLLDATVKAPFRFFARTDSGELLNRFSEDMELIDMDLPSIMVNYTSSAVTVVGQIIILAVFSQYLGIALPVLGTVLYFVQRFYLQTSRQVRLLGIEARAPLYAHFTESVAGAATIRAFGWQRHYQRRNYQNVDTSQRPNYLQSCIQAWLAFILNIVVAALAVILVSIVVTWNDKFSAGSVGVSLTMVIGFSGTLSRLIQNWTKLESSVGAVARVKRFISETEPEETIGRGANVSSEWLQAGALDFSGVTASYGTPNTDPVLKGVSLSILPGQHIAICGRSGSGKSSLILSLLQMIDVTEGQITLDGINIATLLQQHVRSHINVVPQDPFLIPGTVRFNIDPLATASDAEITRALERVRLWSAIQEQGGLDKDIGTTNLSAGQKQIISLARALVKKSKILVLDEAMSSVDTETESIMQEIVDTEFRDCTVLAIMHRLKHVSRYDKVALLENGTLVEYDHPEALMTRDSRFADLLSC